MKRLLLFLSIAGSARAILDVDNIPATMPHDPREKLAWGLCKLDEKAVSEAFDAGVDITEVTFEDRGVRSTENSYKALIASLIMNLNEEGLMNNRNDDITPAMAEKFLKTAQKTRMVWNFLAAKGVSEDVHCNFVYIHEGSAKDFLAKLSYAENQARAALRQQSSII